jgi:hypothetical protein
MAITLSILAVIVAIAVFVMVRRNKGTALERPPPERPLSSKTATAFHAVSIKLGPKSCAAAHEMSGKRFLSGAAPRIPLPECDVLECKCRFVHHKDRRAGDDRRSPFGQGLGGATGTHLAEKRQREDRRSGKSDDTF